MTPWIKCSDRMPRCTREINGVRVSVPVFIKNDDGEVSAAQWSKSGRWEAWNVAHEGYEWEYKGTITHWMPVPK